MSVATSTAIGLGIAGAGVIGSTVSGIVGSNAASNAASTQAAAANNAAALQKQEADDALNFSKLQYGNSLNLLSPFYNTGVSANNQLAYLMGLNPAKGLPAGVTNPNVNNGAPSVGTVGSPVVPGTGVNISTNTASRPGFGEVAEGGTAPMVANALASRLGGGTSSIQQPGTTDTAQAGQVGIQPGVIRQPGAVTDPSNPAASTTAGFQSPTGITGGPIIAGSGTLTGQPGQVPIQNGSTSMPANAFSINQGGTAQVPMVNGGSPNAVAASGGFGSLAQGWGQTFNSPTAVTEQNDPGYQFRQSQGDQVLQNSAAARGGLLSGGTAKALTDFAQNDASNEYANVYNRALNNYNTNYNTFTNDQTNEFNRLSALSGQGQVSANNLSTAGLQTANQVGNTLLTAGQQIGNNINNAGAANASGYVGGANAINGAINGSINSLSLLSLLNKSNPAATGGNM